MKRAYVGNIPFETTEDDLRTWFTAGKTPYVLESVEVIRDRHTGSPKGFAFIEFASEEMLDAAIWEFNGRELGGRKIFVNDATEKKGRRL
jgi:RNA recognition motif-containing protein